MKVEEARVGVVEEAIQDEAKEIDIKYFFVDISSTTMWYRK